MRTQCRRSSSRSVCSALGLKEQVREVVDTGEKSAKLRKTYGECEQLQVAGLVSTTTR